MGIIKRLVRMFEADVHGVLDLLEDPVDICKQAIRDMEGEIALVRQRIADARLRYEQLSKHRELNSQRARDLQQQVQVCLDESDRELARHVVRRKIECEKRARMLAGQCSQAETEIADGERQLSEFEDRLTAVREKLECFGPNETHSARCEPPLEDLFVSDEEVEVALHQLKNERADYERRVTKGEV